MKLDGMKRSKKIGLALTFTPMVLIGLNVFANSQDVGESAAFKPVASVHSLMEGQGHYFKGLGKLIKNPDAPKRLKYIHRKAEILAELANVNTHNRKEADYRAWAASVRDDALTIAREARKKGNADEAVFKKAFSSMKKTCGACHDVYQDD